MTYETNRSNQSVEAALKFGDELELAKYLKSQSLKRRREETAS